MSAFQLLVNPPANFGFPQSVSGPGHKYPVNRVRIALQLMQLENQGSYLKPENNRQNTDKSHSNAEKAWGLLWLRVVETSWDRGYLPGRLRL
jgi:hypothetical protein